MKVSSLAIVSQKLQHILQGSLATCLRRSVIVYNDDLIDNLLLNLRVKKTLVARVYSGTFSVDYGQWLG